MASCSTYYVPCTMLSSSEILNPDEAITIISPILQVNKLRHGGELASAQSSTRAQPRNVAPEVTLLALTLCASLAEKLWVTSSTPALPIPASQLGDSRKLLPGLWTTSGAAS